MGILKAAAGAASGVSKDQFKDFFSQDALEQDVLMVRGKAKENIQGESASRDAGIITNGSVVTVADGQCAVLVSGGKVVEIYDQPGENVVSEGSTPGLFEKGGLAKTVKEVGKRISFGGDVHSAMQRVYYFNTKEIPGNPIETPAPVPVHIRDANSSLSLDASVTFKGMFSFQVAEPSVTYKKLIGNVTDSYRVRHLMSQLNSELLMYFQKSLSEMTLSGVRPNELSGLIPDISREVSEAVSSFLLESRGIRLVSLAFSSFEIAEEDAKTVKELQRDVVLKDPVMAGAHLVGASAEAMQRAGANSGGGSALAAAIMAGSGSGMASDLMKMKNTSWTCECGRVNNGKFCENCGKKKPE